MAIANADERAVTGLLSRGADPNMPDGHGVRPPEVALVVRARAIFEALRKAKVDAGFRFAGGKSYFHIAWERGFTLSPVGSCLKKMKLPVDTVDDAGRSALHYAALGVGSVGDLVKLKADANLADPQGETPMSLALRCALETRVLGWSAEGHQKGTEGTFVIENGTMGFRKGGKGKPRKLKEMTEIDIALKYCREHYDYMGHLYSVAALAKTADLDATTAEGDTILQWLVDLQSKSVDKVLTKRGVTLPTPRPGFRVAAPTRTST